MEAETYLSSGYGLRLAIEERAVGWQRLGHMARITLPNRTKGTLVSSEFGKPWLAATQVFDIRPVPRKWLATGKIKDAEALAAPVGSILVTRSGNVGRSTLATDALKGVLVSDDLLRVEARQSEQWGWIYAYLRSPQAQAMMSGAHYGHIIKHLETSHLAALPVPVVHPEIANAFHQRTHAIIDLRSRAHNLLTEAEGRFASAIGALGNEVPETGFEIRSKEIFSKRRRLEANYYSPQATAILRRFAEMKAKVMPLSDVTMKVWWQTRFRRYYGDGGIPYLSADELFTTNASEPKKILVDPDDGHEAFFVKSGWIVMACSGQVYGLNGSACLMTEMHENIFFSHDLIRIIPKTTEIRPGYLLTALTHPKLGRPLLIRAAYGTSIPHLDPGDVAQFPVVRLSETEENAIANLAEESAADRTRADVLESELAEDAGKYIEKFLAGDMVHFVTTMPAIQEQELADSAALPEHSRVRLLRAEPKAGLAKGAEGTIVHVYEEGGYEVEFIRGLKRPVVLTLEADEIEGLKADA